MLIIDEKGKRVDFIKIKGLTIHYRASGFNDEHLSIKERLIMDMLTKKDLRKILVK